MPTGMEIWSMEKLVPYARNARTHPEVQINKLVESIKHFLKRAIEI
jgi:hypothetical protein